MRFFISNFSGPGEPRLLMGNHAKPKVLVVSQELGATRFFSRPGLPVPVAKAGGMADVCALLVDGLTDAGWEVHLALPFYEKILPDHARFLEGLHLCAAPAFAARNSVYEGDARAQAEASLAFQRDVIRHVMPVVRPDVIHCHDWMTGLIPAAAKGLGIPSIFTVHSMHDHNMTLHDAEDHGVDVKNFWNHLFYEHFPSSFDSIRNWNVFSPLASGIHAAEHVTVVSPGFLGEIERGDHPVPDMARAAIRKKVTEQKAHGILNALPDSYRPNHDPHLMEFYDWRRHEDSKKNHKMLIQGKTGLEVNPDAPLMFWPSRLDPAQKGCHLLVEIFGTLMENYAPLGLQMIFVADGPAQEDFRRLRDLHGLSARVGISGFNEGLSHLGYAASDFTLMPSCYEPCGLSQLASLRYGCLPVVHATGGLRDTIQPLDVPGGCGNGFLFEDFESKAFRASIDDALEFFQRPRDEKRGVIARVMRDSDHAFSPAKMVQRMLPLYQNAIGGGDGCFAEDVIVKQKPIRGRKASTR